MGEVLIGVHKEIHFLQKSSEIAGELLHRLWRKISSSNISRRKKCQLVGNFRNNAAEWQQKEAPVNVIVDDFWKDAEGVAIPYEVYRLGNDKGWVNLGINKDTADFDVQSIRNWRYKRGSTITAT